LIPPIIYQPMSEGSMGRIHDLLTIVYRDELQLLRC